MQDIFSSKFNKILVRWYESNKRELPWRETSNPYLIWISEIILQQTRVAQGYDYYTRFIKNFPDIISLAKANENDVLRLWQGLGYYSRARNLHAAAKTIDQKFAGVFPQKYEDILSLRGVGEYTAAAITSFAYNLPYAVVDGNVYRFLSRLFGISTPINTTKGKKEFSILANELLNKEDPGIHNQAVMEFGALQCVPISPKCTECSFSNYCHAYSENQVSRYPIKQGKTKTKDRFLNYLDIRFNDFLFLHKRTNNDIWKGLYEFPLIETDHKVEFTELQKCTDYRSILNDVGDVLIKNTGITLQHTLSHQKINATFYQIVITDCVELQTKFTKMTMADLDNYPISRLVDKYLLEGNNL